MYNIPPCSTATWTRCPSTCALDQVIYVYYNYIIIIYNDYIDIYNDFIYIYIISRRDLRRPRRDAPRRAHYIQLYIYYDYIYYDYIYVYDLRMCLLAAHCRLPRLLRRDVVRRLPGAYLAADIYIYIYIYI